MDFFSVCSRQAKNGATEIYPDFVVGRSKDLMVRSRSFYAVWDTTANLWSTDEYDVQRIVDEALTAAWEEAKAKGGEHSVKYLRSYNSNGWNQFRRLLSNVSDNSHQLDMNLTFANAEVKKNDYVSRKLSYSLAPGSISAWDQLVGNLYDPTERAKIEWAIGAVIAGDAKKLQKFLVLYGPGGTGKSTILNIIQKLFEGYTTTFEAKALTANNNSFATEVFRNNPLVAIQHDGDLSKIEDNTKLNSIISHEEMVMNEKYRPSYTAKVNAFLFMGTNKPVKISDAKSGIIRRLIDVHPTGLKFMPSEYFDLLDRIDFELGAIANHCLEVYKTMGRNYYNGYRPVLMMFNTDVFFNFVEANYDVFKSQDGISLKQAYALYKEYVKETGVEWTLPQYKFREELRNYFAEFEDRRVVDGHDVRSYYSGFILKPEDKKIIVTPEVTSLIMNKTESLLDTTLADQPAQYGNSSDNPIRYWTANPRLVDGKEITPKSTQIVNTTLSDLNTKRLHFVKVPPNHIVIDFDLTDDDGHKSLERNLEAASKWPTTYAELSKSGSGIHMHYNYDGDPTTLAREYAPGIEIKVFAGDAALRRKLSRCNDVPIVSINSGLPLKDKKMLSGSTMQSEKSLRELIARNLRKEIHPGTKPSVDFIQKILEDAYNSGMTYDVTDLRPKILAFANNSSNQALVCIKLVQSMHFQGPEEAAKTILPVALTTDDREVFFDVEVYPNLFVVCWKYSGSDTIVKMINPKAEEMESLFKLKLIGYNNRRYDNHIIYARFLGYTNAQLYALSQKIIEGNVGSLFGEAYNISFADIYDFSSIKQSLKKFQITLGIHHVELDIPWDKDVPEELWSKVVDYCCNDVLATEATFNDRKQDFVARQILADLSGLSVNDTTQKHTARIIFGTDKNPQKDFVYTRLGTTFPGYEYDRGKSTYRGEEVGEGGYVYAEPGMYANVALLDVASMHPTSIEELSLFGPYTKNFAELKQARMAIKHKDYATARSLLGGKLSKHLVDDSSSVALAYSLKIVINIVYGLTSAKFDNPFRDVRNVDNIVAKRGALFMIDLKHAVQERGFTVAHIKTDSIKIPDATPEIIEFVIEFGKKYGYDFEHEATYDQFCLVNDAVYIARKDLHDFDGDKPVWTAVGAQFQHPYVYKTLFTHEPIAFEDLCEAKSVTQGAMYLDFEHTRPDPTVERMHFVGRTGLFVPVKESVAGGVLYRIKDEKRYAVTGTKGYLWVEPEIAKDLSMNDVNIEYFDRLATNARDTIDYFGPFAYFVR